MADRLAELRRQRALLQVHLAWLDREIIRAGGDPNAGSVPPFGSTPSTSPFVSGSNPPLPLPIAAVAPAAPARPASAAPAPAPSPRAAESREAPPAASHAVGPATPDTEALLSPYRREPEAVKRDVRQGCLLYFLGAFALLALGVTGLYFAFRAR